MSLVDLFITCADQTEANTIRSELLNRRLIACGNTWPVTSEFHWGGVVEAANEVMLLVKTTSEHQNAVLEIVTSLHSYEVPAISIVRVEAGTPAHEQWIIESTQP